MEKALSQARARELRELVLSQVPNAEATVMYAFGLGGYVLAVGPFYRHQDPVVVVNERAWEVFATLRLQPARDHSSGRLTLDQRSRSELAAITRLLHEQGEEEMPF